MCQQPDASYRQDHPRAVVRVHIDVVHNAHLADTGRAQADAVQGATTRALLQYLAATALRRGHAK